ncbi:MAG: hypothetical protein PVG91_07140 [Gammaproteobacteria bacterium]|jgi:hypothetical protein
MNMKLAVLVASASMIAGVAQADTLLVEKVDKTVAASDARPSRGMTMVRVERRFGAPTAKQAPVGDPPISRWQYGDFVVFFEYDRVLHSVERPRVANN